jgi:hypothetical protein
MDGWAKGKVDSLAGMPLELTEGAEISSREAATMILRLKEIADEIQAGNVTGLVMLAAGPGAVRDCFVIGDGCDVYRVIGGLEVLKRDVMRCHAESRVEYQPISGED